MAQWLDWLAAVSSLDDTRLKQSSLRRTGRRRVLKNQSTAAQKQHSDFAVKGGEAPGTVHTATDRVIAHHYLTPSSHHYALYSGARKKLLKSAFVMEAVRISSGFAFVGHGYV